jgi:hypothetical protein
MKAAHRESSAWFLGQRKGPPPGMDCVEGAPVRVRAPCLHVVFGVCNFASRCSERKSLSRFSNSIVALNTYTPDGMKCFPRRFDRLCIDENNALERKNPEKFKIYETFYSCAQLKACDRAVLQRFVPAFFPADW